MSQTQSIVIKPDLVLQILVQTLAVLIPLGLLGGYLRISGYYDDWWWYIHVFDMEYESSFATLLTVICMLLCVLTLIANGESSRDDKPVWIRWSWHLLALVFCYLAFDEAFRVHEYAILHWQFNYDFLDFLYYPWVLPYLIFAATVAIIYIPFLLKIPRNIAVRMVIAGACYVGGAAGVEIIQALEDRASQSTETIPYMLYYTVEESMELMGIFLFLHALLLSLHQRGQKYKVRFDGTTMFTSKNQDASD